MSNYTNSIMNTERCFMYFSRPRRFCKTMAANMLTAHYDERSDSAELFKGLKIENAPTFQTLLNKYPIIKPTSAARCRRRMIFQ